MKRAGALYERIADPENLRLAFWKASRGKRHKADVIRFRAHLGAELDALRRELEAGAVRVGDYHYFRVFDPKERTICAAAFRERVLHHAIVNVCEPVFEAYQIQASYACRKGKGIHAALAEARRWTRARYHCLKLDVRQYFPSIDHAVLLQLLERRFKDRRLLDLFGCVVASYETAPGRGIPIGNLTSQYFANHYLAALDHFVKEDLRVRAYLRYMDDMVLWHDDREVLKGWRRTIEAFAAERLKLTLKAPVLASCAQGLSALGYRVFPGTVRLARRSKMRFARKLRACEGELAAGEITERQAAQRVEPLLAFVRHADTRGLRNKLTGVAPEARTG